MAAYTSVKSGDWNDPTVWASASYPQLDSDTATIAATHVITFNVDLSGLATGLGAITVTGTLKFASGSRLKTAANITGAGTFRCGEDGSEVDDVQILFKGNYYIGVADAQYWGVDRTDATLGYLAANSPIGSGTVTVDRDMDIRLGDVISLGAAAVAGLTTDASNPWGRGLYEVTSYDPGTHVVGITPNIAGNNRATGDMVLVLTRAIRIRQVGTGGAAYVNNQLASQVYRNVWFHAFGYILGGNTQTLVSCVASKSVNRALLYNSTGSTLSACYAADMTNGGNLYNGYSCTLTSCSASNVTNAGNLYNGYSCTLTSCSASNVTNAGNLYNSYSCTLTSCSASNVTNGGNGSSCYACTFTSCVASNVTLGGNLYGGINCTLMSCVASNVTNGGNLHTGFACTLTSCSHNSTYALYLNPGTDNFCSGTWSAKGIYYRNTSYKFPPWSQTIWLDYDAVGRHRVYAYAGYISTAPDLSSIVFNLEDATMPLILDFPLIARATVFNFSQRVQKSASMAILPRIQLVDADDDPLITGAIPLGEDVMTNSIGTDETLSISVSGLTVGKRYKLRLQAHNASGTVTWYGRDIANATGQMTCAGQGDFFKLFP